MSDDSGSGKDLLGDPWTPPRDPRGRKRHKRSALVAENIAVLRASGLTVESIATRTGLSEPTLRKYYLRELEQGPALAQAILDEAMWAKAKDGNVAAARYIRERMDRAATAPQPRSRRVAAEPVERLGKKAQANATALNAHEGTTWSGLVN